VTAYPPWRGSLSEFGKALIDELAKSRQVREIHVIANICEGGRSVTRNGKVILYRSWRMNSIRGPLLAFYDILRSRPSLIYLNVHLAVFGPGRLVNFLWSLLPVALKFFRFKVVTPLHNIFERINLREAKFKDCLLNRIGLTVATGFYSLSDSIVVTMRSYVNLIRKKYGGRAVFIPHGAWFFCGQRNPSHPSHGHHILFLGYIGPYKSMELLIEAFKLLNAEKQSVKLLFSGSIHPNYIQSGLLDKIDKGSNITYLGYVPDEKLSELMKDVSLIALPYATCTGTSGVLHLLASFGKPFVATDLPEFIELKREGAGILTVKKDPKLFYWGMKKLLEDEVLYKELSRKNLEYAHSRSWDKIANEYVKLFRKILSQG